MRSPRRPVTEDPLPALTTMPSPRSRAAARPESRSLPVTIFAFGQISRHICFSAQRSSSVPQPARKTPARSICFGNSARIARRCSGEVSRKFEAGSFPCSRTRNSQAEAFAPNTVSTKTHAVLVPPPSTPRMRSPGFTIVYCRAGAPPAASFFIFGR